VSDPACDACGKPVGRGIDRCQDCIRLGRTPRPPQAPGARQNSSTADGLTALLWVLFGIGTTMALAGHGSSPVAFWLGVSAAGLAIGAALMRAVIVSALHTHAREQQAEKP
jgi:hypothetical protein